MPASALLPTSSPPANGQRAHESLSNRALVEGDATVRRGIVRFADDAIFTPNVNDIPLWAQTPLGAMVFQLKSFPLMMQRMADHILSEAKQGNVKPLLYLATLAPAMGMTALASKDIIQQRGGEDNRSPELRKRNLLKLVGYDKDVHGDEDDFLGWYVEGLMVAGGLGLIADAMFGIATQVDDGAYGQVRVASLLGGPSVGAGFAGMTAASGLLDSEASNAKERSGTQEVVTRIPILGGVRSLRESIVDAVAGKSEKDDPNPYGRASYYKSEYKPSY